MPEERSWTFFQYQDDGSIQDLNLDTLFFYSFPEEAGRNEREAYQEWMNGLEEHILEWSKSLQELRYILDGNELEEEREPEQRAEELLENAEGKIVDIQTYLEQKPENLQSNPVREDIRRGLEDKTEEGLEYLQKLYKEFATNNEEIKPQTSTERRKTIPT